MRKILSIYIKGFGPVVKSGNYIHACFFKTEAQTTTTAKQINNFHYLYSIL